MSQPPGQPQQTAQIISVVDIPSQDPTRAGKFDTMITYRIDPLHTFTITVPKAPLSKDEVIAAVRADWAKRKDVYGLNIPL